MQKQVKFMFCLEKHQHNEKDLNLSTEAPEKQIMRNIRKPYITPFSFFDKSRNRSQKIEIGSAKKLKKRLLWR